MNLHNQIMNIQINEESAFYKYGNEALYAYKEGHRDARHSAAELSLKAEARIEELEDFLKTLWYDCSNGQKSAIDIILKRVK